jgi:Flp pilus assembly protein TadD
MNDDVRAHLEALAAAGDQQGLNQLAWEFFHAGDMQHAEAASRAAREAGHPQAIALLARILDRLGRVDEAEVAYRTAFDAGDESALLSLADMLLYEASRAAEVEDLLRTSVERGVITAQYVLGKFLARQPGRKAEAEEALNAEVHPAIVGFAKLELAHVLAGQPGREAEVEQALRASGVPEADEELARLLSRMPGRVDEAVEAMRRAAENGVANGWNNLTVMLKELGRLASAEVAYRDGLAAGELSLLVHYGEFLRLQNRNAEAEQVLRHGLDIDPRCAYVLGLILLKNPARREEARELLVRAAGAGVGQAAVALARRSATA